MNIGLIDVDWEAIKDKKKTKRDKDGRLKYFPNLALMKLSAYHKSIGDTVNWYVGEADPVDYVYASKVFTFTPDYQYFPSGGGIPIYKGGSGYDNYYTLPPQISRLEDHIESLCPDYALYPDMNYSMGFLTRGCPNKCPHCIVWRKEGNIHPAADIEDFCRHDKVLLMDNNVLASDWGIKQIEKIIKLGIRVDFNQGLDARLIDDSMAKLLSKVKWLEPLRLACDSSSMMSVIQKAVEALRWYNTTPTRYSCYVLLRPGEIEDAVKRVRFLKGLHLDPFVQPYQPPEGRKPEPLEEDLARYCDMKATFKGCWWEEYKPENKEVLNAPTT